MLVELPDPLVNGGVQVAQVQVDQIGPVDFEERGPPVDRLVHELAEACGLVEAGGEAVHSPLQKNEKAVQVLELAGFSDCAKRFQLGSVFACVVQEIRPAFFEHKVNEFRGFTLPGLLQDWTTATDTFV